MGSCVGNESVWQQCIFSEYSLKYMTTPTFVINSIYNFGEWAMLTPTYPAGRCNASSSYIRFTYGNSDSP
jgi:hypothetical protein